MKEIHATFPDVEDTSKPLQVEEEEEEEEEELSVVTFTAQHARTRPDGTNDAIDDAETGV